VAYLGENGGKNASLRTGLIIPKRGRVKRRGEEKSPACERAIGLWDVPPSYHHRRWPSGTNQMDWNKGLFEIFRASVCLERRYEAT
jgi:hypothetical protein